MDILTGILIPFIGTTAGSACVFFLRGELKPGVQKAFLGFASGVMVAASVWSLLIPAMEMSDGLGRLAFLPAVTGFLLGMAFLLFLDMVVPHLHMDTDQPEGAKSNWKKSTMLVLAVTLHNIPEVWLLQVCWQKVSPLHWQAPWHCHWELRSRISRKERLSPFL